jgi:hypothetical protein
MINAEARSSPAQWKFLDLISKSPMIAYSLDAVKTYFWIWPPSLRVSGAATLQVIAAKEWFLGF